MKSFSLTIVALLALLFPVALFAQGEDFGEEGFSNEELEDAGYESEAPMQEDAPTDDAKGVETYWGMEDLNEVEKGFFMNLRLGYYHFLLGDLADQADGGFEYGIGLGYDIPIPDFERLLTIELNAIASGHKADYDPLTLDAQGKTIGNKDAKVKGDFMALRVPLVINVKPYTTKRFELVIGVLGGLFYNNQAIDGFKEDQTAAYGDSQAIDYFAGGRLGVEYYTGLRHFSIGLEVEVNYILSNGYLALGAQPTLKYTF